VTGPANSFAPVLEVASLLSGFDRPWFIAGGWAIDLFLGNVSRVHEDVDVAVLRRDQRDLRSYLTGWELGKIADGRREPWREEEWLNLPIHEVHADRTAGVPREVEFLLNEARDGTWIFRRDARITRPLSKVRMVTRSGIPFLGPAIVLLYKAKDPTPKDDADFGRARPRLGLARRLWLRGALETCHPGHPWISRL
jgi:hypothetical protein